MLNSAPLASRGPRRFTRRFWAHRKGLALAALFVMLALPNEEYCHAAKQPKALLQEEIDKVLGILQNPHFRQPAMRPAQRARLSEIADRLFDFHEFSKLTLGPFWPRFTRAERVEFEHAFKTFLKDAYIGIAQDQYTDERVILLDQRIGGQGKAQVPAKIVWKGLEVPVEFRMLQYGVKWKVYDMVVLGISGVRIYRAQFKAFLEKRTPAELIKRIIAMSG